VILDTSSIGIPHRQFVSVCEYEAALMRMGSFGCIFATVERCADLKHVFDSGTQNDEILARWLTMTDHDRETFVKSHHAAFREYVAQKHR
jgi:hypothetical protein